MVKVSIICEITHQHQDKHPFLINTVLDQTFKKFEIIFWDNVEGQSSPFFKQAEQKLKNLKYTSNKDNTLEKIVKKAKNTIVVVLNEELFILPNFLKKITTKVNRNVVVFKNYYTYNVFTKKFLWVDLDEDKHKLYNRAPVCFSKNIDCDFDLKSLFEYNDKVVCSEKENDPRFFTLYVSENEMLLSYIKDVVQPKSPAVQRLIHSMKPILNTKANNVEEVEIQNINNQFFLKVPEFTEKQLPKVSVLTLTKNREHLFDFPYHLWKLYKYPRDKIEWVIIDDSDKKMTKEYLEEDGIKYIWLEKGMKIGEKRNIGIEKHCSSEYIVMMDDDDYYYPDSVIAKIRCLLHYKQTGKKCLISSPCGIYNTLTNRSHITSRSINVCESVPEASLAFHRDFWNVKKFSDTQFSEGKQFIKDRENEIVNLPFWFNFIAFTHGKNATESLRNLDTPYDKNAPNFFDFFGKETQEIIKSVFKTQKIEELLL